MGVKEHNRIVKEIREEGQKQLAEQIQLLAARRRIAVQVAEEAEARRARAEAANKRSFQQTLHLFALQCYVNTAIVVGLVKPDLEVLGKMFVKVGGSTVANLKNYLQRPPPLKLWQRFQNSLPQALAHEAADYVISGRLRRVPMEKRNHRDGYVPEEVAEEDEGRRECREKAEERISLIRSWIVATEERVKMQVLGMPATETRYIRAKNMLLQAIDSFKFTNEEIVRCGVYDWAADFLAEIRKLTKVELRLIAARSERDFKEANAHYKVTVNNEWLVETACGSLFERVTGLMQNGDSVAEATRVACQRTLGSICSPFSAYNSWSVFWAMFFWTGFTFAGLAVPTVSVPAAFSAALMMLFALFKLFSANFHGKRWRDVRTGA
jgi:hypothetical protein